MRTDDWFLAALVDLCEKHGLSTSITLYVRGTTISGQMISSGQYYDRFDQNFFDNAPELQDIRGMFGNLHDRPENHPDIAVEYIHLDSVSHLNTNGQTTNLSGVVWRGRLQAIDGFYLGRPGTPD